MIDPTLHTSIAAQTTGVRGPTSAPSSATADGSTAVRGARFQALLEELDMRAKAMAKSVQEPLSAETLPAAIEDARSSMEDALALSRNLLEACRQSAAQAPESKTQP